MIATLPLDKMTITDKILTMEVLWDNICKTPSDFTSPGWHKSILEEREKAVKEGTDEFIDWQEAKKDIFYS